MIKPLTSLRFIFALMVMLSHCIVINPSFDKHIFQEGFVGVSFFFVLSGFIISYRYKNSFVEQNLSKTKFWAGRIARIYPLHLLTLGGAILLHLETWQNILTQLQRLLPNFLLLQAFIPDPDFYYSFNNPSWSLCCELFFYALFPFLIQYLTTLRKLLLACGVFGSLILVGMTLTPENQTIVNTLWYVNPIARLCDFFIGMLVFELYNRYRKVCLSFKIASTLEVIAVSLFLLFYLFAEDFSIVYRASSFYWLPVGLVIFIFAFQKGFLSQVLGCKTLIYLGEISFGMYLIHFLVLDVFIRVTAKMEVTLSASFSFFIVLFVTLLLSGLSFRFFERPANRWVKRRIQRLVFNVVDK
jgi:peptidoglycan/LPS O-acetylase OafA/YrhL